MKEARGKMKDERGERKEERGIRQATNRCEFLRAVADDRAALETLQ